MDGIRLHRQLAELAADLELIAVMYGDGVEDENTIPMALKAAVELYKLGSIMETFSSGAAELIGSISQCCDIDKEPCFRKVVARIREICCKLATEFLGPPLEGLGDSSIGKAPEAPEMDHSTFGSTFGQFTTGSGGGGTNDCAAEQEAESSESMDWSPTF